MYSTDNISAARKAQRVGGSSVSSPLGRAVYSWIRGLDDCPKLNEYASPPSQFPAPRHHCHRSSNSTERNVHEALILSYTKDIVKDGLQAFDDIAGDVETFPALQKVMTKRLFRPMPRKSATPKELMRLKLEKANRIWSEQGAYELCGSSLSSYGGESTSIPTSPLSDSAKRNVSFTLEAST